MTRFNIFIKSCRAVLFLERHTVRNLLYVSGRTNFSPSFITNNYVNTRAMSQKSITSFFKITPKKSSPGSEEKHKDDSFTSNEVNGKETPKSNGDEKRTSKRLRTESSDSDSPKTTKRVSSASPATSEKKKKAKRQRIESSGSECDSPAPVTEGSPHTSTEASPKEFSETVKLEKNKPKTYESPKSKKGRKKREEIEDSSTTEAAEVKERRSNSPSLRNDGIKKEISPEVTRTSSVKVKEEQTTPATKKKKVAKVNGPSPSPPKQAKKENSSVIKETKTENSPATEETKKETSPPKKRNPFDMMKTKASSAGKENEEKTQNGDEDKDALVPEESYNPGKAKYHPIKDACWAKDQAVPYLALAKTLEVIEATSARLKMVEILSNYFRSVIVLTPEDLLPSIYMCLNQLAPAYHSLELGIAETYLLKAVGQCTGRTLAQLRAGAARLGDLGLVAERARAAQRTMFAQPKLTCRKVFAALKEIAAMTGHASVNKKISKIQSLYVACRHSEARYLIRSLEGKLRVGLAEQSLLQALARACAASPPGGAPGGERGGEPAGELDAAAHMHPDEFKARVDEYALIIKTTYCECPNYELVVPVLLQHGVAALPQHCRLQPGVPLKPMLAHPTKGVHEVFARFDKEQLTCEWKYDGERAQLHVPGAAAPDLARAAVFSRSQEDNTSKYPDILSRLPSLLKETVTSCVLDCEAVAYDTATKQILPFQVLSTRKRKDVDAGDIKVQVCVFMFDLLYLNGRPLVREPLLERRRLLREHFNEHEGTWQFAKGQDCGSAEEVQQQLELAVRGSCEGLMVKALRGERARYDIARRSHNWLKLKKDYLEGVGDTIDVVVIGGYRGKGKRSGHYGGFLLACPDPETDQLQSLCKIGTGFSDEDLRSLSDQLDQHVIDAPPNYYRYDSSHSPDAWFAAARVWEVRCADLSLSPAHRAAAGLVDPEKGISLRFPRFIRVREDKTPEQATPAQQLADMYLAQDQVRNQNKPVCHDDFY